MRDFDLVYNSRYDSGRAARENEPGEWIAVGISAYGTCMCAREDRIVRDYDVFIVTVPPERARQDVRQWEESVLKEDRRTIYGL